VRPPGALLGTVEAARGERVRGRRLDRRRTAAVVVELEGEQPRAAARQRYDGGRAEQRRRVCPKRAERRARDRRDLLLGAVAEEDERQVERLGGRRAEVVAAGY
jgi:hypothetical protein